MVIKKRGWFGNNMSIWIIIFRVVLEYIYVQYLSTIWDYSGFENNSNIFNYILSWGVLVFFIPIISRLAKEERPTSIMLTILYLMTFVPCTVMLGRQPTSVEFYFLLILYWLLLIIAYYCLPVLRFKKPSQRACYYITEMSAVFFSLIVIFVWAYYAHFRITVNFFDVYGIREEWSQYRIPTALTYLLAASRAIIPCLCVYKLARKSYFSFALLSFVQIINFSIDGLKSALFALLFSIVCYFWYSNQMKEKLPMALSALCIVSILEEKIIGTFTIITVFIRRVLFVPALLNYFYYDFFSVNELDYFKQGFLKYFGVSSTYSQRIPYLIGSFKGSAGEYANNGLFSDAFCNLGVVGIVIMPFLVIAVLNLFDTATERVDTKIVVGAIIANCMTLIGSGLTVFLITQGFLVTCILVFFFPEDIHYKERSMDER